MAIVFDHEIHIFPPKFGQNSHLYSQKYRGGPLRRWGSTGLRNIPKKTFFGGASVILITSIDRCWRVRHRLSVARESLLNSNSRKLRLASWQTAKAANFDKSVLAKGLKSLNQLNMPRVVGRQTQMLFEYTCKGLKSLDQSIS